VQVCFSVFLVLYANSENTLKKYFIVVREYATSIWS